MIEEWRDIDGYDGLYKVSNLGNVYSLKTNKVLKTPVGKRGYPNLNLLKDGKQKLFVVHRLVAKAFIPNPENKQQVNHIDGDKTNNRVDNLEWATSRENMLHARRTGLHTSDGDKTVVQMLNGQEIARYKSASEASRKTGIGRANISNVCRGYHWNGRHCKSAGGYEWKYA